MQDRQSAAQFTDNPEPRFPWCLIVDRSFSMIGGRIKAVNDALAQFKALVLADTLASLHVEILLVSFNHTVDYVDFCSVQDFQPPELSASGGTNMAPAINTALDLLDRRKQEYRANGVSYLRPIVLLITDGQADHDTPHDTPKELAVVRARLDLEEEDRHIAFFSFGIEDADVEALSGITSLSSLHMCDCGRVSSTPGDRILEPLDKYLE